MWRGFLLTHAQTRFTPIKIQAIICLLTGMILLGYSMLRQADAASLQDRTPELPPVAETVVSSVSSGRIPKLVNLAKIADHLECCETVSTKSVDVFYPAPKQAYLFGSSCGDKIAAPVRESAEAQRIGLFWAESCRRVSFCGFREGESRFRAGEIKQSPFRRDGNGIGRSLSVVIQNDMDSPIFVIPCFGFGPRKIGGLYQNVSSELPFGRTSPVADLHNDNDHKQQSNYREGITSEFLEELADEIPVVAGFICGTIGIAIYLNSRGFFGSFVGMSLIVVGVLFPWRALIMLVI